MVVLAVVMVMRYVGFRMSHARELRRQHKAG